jgi:hypothetical protein
LALIRASNSLQSIATKTYLTDPITAGGTSFAVKNTNTFGSSWAFQVGSNGEERSEIKILDNISGLNLRTTGTATFDHPTDTPIYAIKYDKVIFKRSTAGTSGTATALTNGTVTIQPDQLFTQFDDTSSQSGYAYKASFYNSVTTEETADSDWLTTTGYNFYSRAKIRERIKGKLYDSNFIESDDTINDWINEWLEHMNNAAVHVNQDYSMGTVNVSFGTAGYGTITSTNFKDIRKVDITTDGNNWYTAQRISQTDFYPQEIFNASTPVYYPFGDDVIGVKPDGEAGTARISYYTRASILDSDGDELPVPMRAYTKSFVDYGLAQALQVDGKPSEAKEKLRQAESALSLFVSDITPRSNSGPRFIKIIDSVGSDDDIVY